MPGKITNDFFPLFFFFFLINRKSCRYNMYYIVHLLQTVWRFISNATWTICKSAFIYFFIFLVNFNHSFLPLFMPTHQQYIVWINTRTHLPIHTTRVTTHVPVCNQGKTYGVDMTSDIYTVRFIYKYIRRKGRETDWDSVGTEYLRCDTKSASSTAGWLSRDNRSTRHLPLWCRSGRSSCQAGVKQSERLKHTSITSFTNINIKHTHTNTYISIHSILWAQP